MREFLDRFVGNLSMPALLVSTCFWSWLDLVPLSPLIFSMNGAEANPAVPAAAFVLGALVLALFALHDTLRARMLNPGFFALMSLMFGSLGTAVVYAGVVREAAPLLSAGVALLGVYEGVGMALVGCLTVCQGKTNALIHLAASLPFNIVFIALGMFLQPGAAVVLCTLLPMLAALSYKVFLERGRNKTVIARVAATPTATHSSEEDEVAHNLVGRWGSIVVLLLVITVSFGFANCKGLDFGSSPFPPFLLDWSSLFIRAVVAFLVFVAYVFGSRQPYSLLITAVMLMATGLFALGLAPSASSTAHFAAYTLFCAGYAVFDLLIWAIIVIAHRGSPLPIQRFLCIAYAFDQLGCGLGAFAGMVELSPAALTLVYNGLGAAVLLLAFAVLNTRNAFRINLAVPVIETAPATNGPLFTELASTSPESPAAQAADAPQAPIEDFGEYIQLLASRYFLTEREANVLHLLFAGRSVPYIAEQLTVSQNTIKTHVRHIYTKLDVHSRQELLDLLGRRENLQ